MPSPLALTPGVITGSGMLLAAFLLILGATGLVNVVAKVVPRPVVRGVQLSTGVLLLSKGASLIIGTSSFQVMRGGAEPFLSVQAIGPVPMSVFMGVLFGVVTLFLLRSRRYPAGLVVVVCGAVFGAALGAWRELSSASVGFYLPEILPFGFPTGLDFTYCLFALVLPQIPMTMGNAVIASRDLSFEYFGEDSRRVTDRALCPVHGAGQCLFIGGGRHAGMPRCGRTGCALRLRCAHRRVQFRHRRILRAPGRAAGAGVYQRTAPAAHGWCSAFCCSSPAFSWP